MTAYGFDTDDNDDLNVPGAGDVDLPEPDHSPLAAADDPLFGGFDVAGLAVQLVRPAVQKAIGRKVDELAAAAVATALSAEVLDQLRAEAAETTRAVLSGPHRAGLAPDDDTPDLYYGSTNEFVREYLRHVYKRKINGSTLFWSPRWWGSAEATARLEALWRAWEHLRLDPSTGPSVWWRDHADHHMSVLMSGTGPFSKEVDVKASILEPLPHEEPPEGLFPDVRETQL